MSLKISEVQPSVLNETTKTTEKAATEDFSFTLRKLDESGLKERISGLLDDITTQGKKLAEHMDIKDMKAYRGLVTDFINEIVTNSHEFSRENFLDRRGRHRVYGIVKMVNQSLDDIAQELLKQEKDNLKVLDKVDEIRGMLLDISL